MLRKVLESVTAANDDPAASKEINDPLNFMMA